MHKEIGPGLLESVYKRCLEREFFLAGLEFQAEFAVPLSYKGLSFSWCYRADFLVAGSLVVEVKAVEKLLTLHVAQTRTYIRLLEAREGLLVNFNSARLAEGGLRSISL